MKWLEINATISNENEEIVAGIFYSIGANALDIEDPNDLIDLSQRKQEWDFFGIDLEGLNFDKIKIKAYFSKEEDIDSILSFLKENIEAKGLGSISTTEIEDEDYLNNWKKYFKPFKIGDNIIIKPSWEEYDEKKEDIIIDIDPGMAFGTGTHETTSLCIEALEKYIKKGDTVFDIGCGSGILSIVCAKLGAKKVVAIDLDPLCVKISKENILKNNLEDIVEVKKGDLLQVIKGKADVIVANIIAEIILNMTDSIKNYLIDGGIFISSGIILNKKDMVLEALNKNDFKIEEIKIQGEWVSIISVKN
ncbi:50S ribosomal protein L11 methyltransferase [Tissierella creatinophila]|uniref:Ribosomal protein L11 methyltransferase n=1 Tax=Tissierella creatinophila DSM 6911 TaxID=1123403 RepID=A0A1U7M7X7_TISCR|nr:50S ribosomal protein L11 methyltransferase [Tissierella creatinophila]OLS03385.1 ribosomal protein L11 methyltransferase [Tissierella creatinophila DSM 6911]